MRGKSNIPPIRLNSKAVKRAMEARTPRWTYAELGQRCGIDGRAIQRWVVYHSNIAHKSAKELRELGKALRLSWEELVEE